MTPHVEIFEQRHIELALALYRECPGVGLSAGDSPREIARFLDRNRGFSAVVAGPAGGLIGAIMCGHDGRRGFLYHLAVHDAERRQGLGRALVAHSVAALAQAGIPRVSIHVFAGNAEGALFWSKLGFYPRSDLHVLQTELGGATG